MLIRTNTHKALEDIQAQRFFVENHLEKSKQILGSEKFQIGN